MHQYLLFELQKKLGVNGEAWKTRVKVKYKVLRENKPLFIRRPGKRTLTNWVRAEPSWQSVFFCILRTPNGLLAVQ